MSTLLINVGMSILVGVFFIIAGLILLYKPPKDINGLYGYRTTRSMKNKVLWKEGNKYSAKLLILFGVILMVLDIVVSLAFSNGEYTILVIIGLMIVSSIFLIMVVERKLKQLEKTLLE
ncbi:SdpI family protein [Rummeliibacillus sp. TYF-LIM-RU47]|uniref:SdpI family protein n=1 Tax=unclassified Rummeliibacillus TaxID=2622809 RepID=UPI001238F188|nr:SdpI family protein [Rummeliibacillus sp. TYF-LIM-RU47]